MRKTLRYKGVTVNLLGIPVSDPYKKNNTRLGVPGRKYYQYKYFNHNYKNTAPRDMIVVYDFPLEKKKERDWFRRHLKQFDYIMIKNSVWVGPSPLPKDFLNYVKSIGLSKQLITLKLAKPYAKGDINL